jgi:hypothetical protein
MRAEGVESQEKGGVAALSRPYRLSIRALGAGGVATEYG